MKKYMWIVLLFIGLAIGGILFFYNSLLRAKKISFLNEFLFEYIKPFEFLKKDESNIILYICSNFIYSSNINVYTMVKSRIMVDISIIARLY